MASSAGGARSCFKTCTPTSGSTTASECTGEQTCIPLGSPSQNVCVGAGGVESGEPPPPGSSIETAPSTPFTPITPNLGVPIPGLELTPATRTATAVNVPFLAQYINALYRYAIGITLVAAIVMVVYGGFRYLVGAGAGGVQRGKEIIRDAIVGMLLVISAYLILNTLNPATTTLQILSLDYVSPEAIVASELGVDFGDDEEGAEAPPGPSGPVSSEDCAQAAVLLREGAYTVRAANDREGLLSGDAIPRRACIWCYNGRNRRGESDDPCYDDPPGGPTVNPRICKLLVDLVAAKRAGQVTGNISVACIICSHTRAAQGREDTPGGRARCERTKQNILGGNTGPGSGQSNHWDGRGLDLAPNPSIQRYIAETLFPAYGSIDDLIGPSFWEGSTVVCPSNADERRGTARSPYLCKNGRCNATWDANALCGHRDHIHVGFYR